VQVVKVEHTLFEVAVGARDSNSSLEHGSWATQTVSDSTVAGAAMNSPAAQVDMGLHTRLEVMVGAAVSKVSPTMQ
jgi:hypothetical protein